MNRIFGGIKILLSIVVFIGNGVHLYFQISDPNGQHEGSILGGIFMFIYWFTLLFTGLKPFRKAKTVSNKIDWLGLIIGLIISIAVITFGFVGDTFMTIILKSVIIIVTLYDLVGLLSKKLGIEKAAPIK
jgi:hypothetical protein